MQDTIQAELPRSKSRGAARRRAELKFAPDAGFQRVLRERVDQYFESTGLRPRDCPRMYLKTATILIWLGASYALLLMNANVWWLAAPLSVSLGLAMAACGFGVQHDGGHSAYSSRSWLNRLTACTLDLLGGSSYVWAQKHNVIHHSYSNVTGHDDDIDLGFFARVSPHQKRLRFHRLQHVYLWALYGLLPIKWQLYDDFRDVIRGRIGDRPIARPRGWDLATLIAGKLLFVSLAFVIPMTMHSVAVVLLCYLLTSFVQGVTLSVVFQLAHCVEDAEFPMPAPESGRIESAWAVHQVQTTVDFGRENRWLTWFVGGLNFQIEHHLFPRICHVHYPALSRIVEETCRESGVSYRAHPTFRAGVASHFRWLRRMGRPGNVETT